MRDLSADFQAHLNSGITSLCSCWRLTLKNGERLGFTDHDVDFVFDGTTFEAQAGMTASESETSQGLSVDNVEVAGALNSTRLDEARLHAGDYDHADIEIWRVNWNDPTQRVLERKGHLGEITLADQSFTAELRGLAHVLDQERGRVYQHTCDATLGDVQCGVDLEAAHLKATAIVVAKTENTIIVSGLMNFPEHWFARGTLTFASGAKLSLLQHRKFGTLDRLELWETPRFSVGVGDTIVARAGCDKTFTTCRTKFLNASNFRGFPHLPGNDFVMRGAGAGDTARDGAKQER